ncbi:MAG: hypothetical protein KAI94_06035, partial [Anaerolineales bacterium]|nr:hypothetical protein [Anaerolineales bacterium]
MFIARLSKELFTYLKVLVIFTLLLPVHGISGAFAQEDVTALDAAHVEEVGTLDTNDLGLLNMADMGYHIDVATLVN